MGSTVTQVACGRRHLLCRVGERILACGYGARGQLGCPHKSFALVPTPVSFLPNEDSPVSYFILLFYNNNEPGMTRKFPAVCVSEQRNLLRNTSTIPTPPGEHTQ